MIGKIEATKRSGSGKSLGVKVGDAWYTTTTFELEHEIGKTIIFEPSHSPASGNYPAMNWLNDYVFEDQQTTPAGQAMDQAMGQTYGQGTGKAAPFPPLPNPDVPRGTPNKDAEIAANGLCHCLRPKDAQEAWDNFTWLYHKFNNWNPEEEPPY